MNRRGGRGHLVDADHVGNCVSRRRNFCRGPFGLALPQADPQKIDLALTDFPLKLDSQKVDFPSAPSLPIA